MPERFNHGPPMAASRYFTNFGALEYSHDLPKEVKEDFHAFISDYIMPMGSYVKILTSDIKGSYPSLYSFILEAGYTECLIKMSY